ncbi:MAG: TetR family transcriptional regulator [Acidimicrobiia bacterium]|nr:MAG: TetR family transcriptional regulator [Acidimicrobiia bacterium]
MLMVRQIDLREPGDDVRDGTADRVLDAALACVARVGVAKTTLDDVARAAGCSRATVYRYFPGKQPLLAAAVAREADRLAARVVAAAAAEATLAGATVAVLQVGARVLAGHDALTYVLTVEPEAVLPHISFDGGSALLAEAAARLAPAFIRFVDPDHALRLAEWVARIGISYLCSPEVDELFDDDRVRALVEDFVLPGLVRPAPSQEVVPS